MNKKVNRKAVYCPRCKSLDVQFIQNNRKTFSTSKAIIGGALAGPRGALAGVVGETGRTNKWRCNDCGRTFTSSK